MMNNNIQTTYDIELADKFAMAVLPALVSSLTKADLEKGSESVQEGVSKAAYKIADAMLVARRNYHAGKN